MNEPLIHSHISDCLPEDHRSAYKMIWCSRCGKMLHASNNECMTTWLEFVELEKNICGNCIGEYLAEHGFIDTDSDFIKWLNTKIERE